MKKPPLIQRLASWVARIPSTLPFCVHLDEMQAEGRPHGKEAGDLPALPESLDHRRQFDVGKSVAVVGKEHLLAFDMLAHGQQALADVAPNSGVDHGDAPVLLGIAQDLDVVAETGDDAVGVDVRPVVEEELLDDVRLVAKAQDEILVPVLAVIVHQVPEDRLIADRDHRLGNALGIIADARAETSAEQNCLHLSGPSWRKSGLGRPASRWRAWA